MTGIQARVLQSCGGPRNCPTVQIRLWAGILPSEKTLHSTQEPHEAPGAASRSPWNERRWGPQPRGTKQGSLGSVCRAERMCAEFINLCGHGFTCF